MTTKYKHPSEVPDNELVARLRELADVVTKRDLRCSEFTMRIPAECDRDADIVLSEAANRLEARAPSGTVAVEDMKLRELLWLRHGCSITMLYGDDGEMQCSKCCLDFKTCSPHEIQEAIERNNRAALADKGV